MLLLIAIIAVLCGLLYFYITHNYTYWERRGIPQADLCTVLQDVTRPMIGLETFVENSRRIYKRCKEYRVYGSYQINAPVLLLRDQEVIKTITVKDFDHFTDHRDLAARGSDPIWAKNLFALKGEKWRVMRTTMSPTFTGAKMRAMFGLIDDVAQKFVAYYKNGPKQFTLEFKDSFTRLSNDVIASTAFGLECNSLKERDNQFYLMGKEATNFSTVARSMQLLLAQTMPKLAQIINVQFFSANVRKFFGDLIPLTMKMREEQNIIRPDLINIMMEARKGVLKFEEDQQLSESSFTNTDALRLKELSDEDITAQAVIFVTGGFDTVATALTFCAYELAVNPEVQTKLRREIEETLEKSDGKLTYENVTKMKYMEMVVSESLRKWPPASVIDRVCTKTYTIPASKPGETDITLKPGEIVMLPIGAIHRDPEIYPEPDVFKPERFSDENKHLITPYNYMPFGVGPRICIAIRFALMEVKTALSRLLVDFEIIPVERTQVPLKLKKGVFTLASENGFWFGLKRLNK